MVRSRKNNKLMFKLTGVGSDESKFGIAKQ
jgi:hypothetical protein